MMVLGALLRRLLVVVLVVGQEIVGGEGARRVV